MQCIACQCGEPHRGFLNGFCLPSSNLMRMFFALDLKCQLNGFAPELVNGLRRNMHEVNGMLRFGWAEPFRFSRSVPFDRCDGTTSSLHPVPTVRYAVPNLRYVLLRYNFRFPILHYFKTVALESDFLILGRNDNVASSIQNSIFGRIGITNFKRSIITYKWPYMR